jgi:hypothetical protein
MSKMDFNKNLGNLDRNYLFQASLGSKELFHSNMLAWMLKQEDENEQFPALNEFLKLLSIKVNIESQNDFRVFREKANLDLVIAFRQEGNVKFVVIENKFKSIPSKNQLLKYNEVIDSLFLSAEFLGGAPKKHATCVARILLCMIDAKSQIADQWRAMSYKAEFIPFLESIKNCRFKNQDVCQVIEKYILFVNDFISIFEEFQIKEFKNGGLYDFYDVDHPERGRGSQRGNRIELLRDLRIRDVILKYVHHQISLEVHDRLQKKNKEVKLNRAVGEFSNSSGISTIAVLFPIGEKGDNKVEIGLQLQQEELRYFVYSNFRATKSATETKSAKKASAGKFNLALTQKLFSEKLWFFNTNGEPFSGKRASKKEGQVMQLPHESCFYKFDKVFLYLKDPVKRGTSLDSLVERMAQDILENVWNEKVAIQLIIDDITREHEIE